jgi:predicted SAM-dependent methyltransferase
MTLPKPDTWFCNYGSAPCHWQGDSIEQHRRYHMNDVKLLKLNIGSGPFKMEGYTNVDLLPGPNVDVVASADKLPFKDGEVDEILAEHLIEHLTFFQFNKAMAEWHRVLRPGGTLVIECPDLLGLCQQFVEANEYGRYNTFKGYWPIIAHFYGHQRGKNEAEEMSQVHKSGYTSEHLIEVLEGIGYEEFERETPKKATPHSPVLRLRATKCQQ